MICHSPVNDLIYNEKYFTLSRWGSWKVDFQLHYDRDLLPSEQANVARQIAEDIIENGNTLSDGNETLTVIGDISERFEGATMGTYEDGKILKCLTLHLTK